MRLPTHFTHPAEARIGSHVEERAEHGLWFAAQSIIVPVRAPIVLTSLVVHERSCAFLVTEVLEGVGAGTAI